jgi:hypothetical protein
MRVSILALALALSGAPAFAGDTVTAVSPERRSLDGYYFGSQTVLPPATPAGGCVWDNGVYSDGAILERRQFPTTFFRCTAGRWHSFDSFDEARAGAELGASPVFVPPPRTRSH